MDKFVVQGPSQLNGSISAGGSKNATLPMLFATLLTDKPCEISNVPRLEDMNSTSKILSHLGSKVDIKKTGEFGSVWNTQIANATSLEAPYDYVRKMRASFLCLGPLLARFGRARVSLPGGCAIGARPVDFHLMAFEKLGAVIEQKEGYVEARWPEGKSRLVGGHIVFPKVSVGATENAVMAASLAEGKTTIENAAQEPEVRELCEALVSMGAQMSGIGTSKIEITGVKNLNGLKWTMAPDRIEVATYLIAAHLTGGRVEVLGAKSEDLSAILEALKASGAIVSVSDKGIAVEGKGKILPVNITTAPFPGFPTDAQAQWMTLMTQAEGACVIQETIFENRFMHVPELKRMSADLDINGNSVTVKGSKGCLSGAPVMATDLRASASLVLAGLVARGETQVKRIYHLDRGYESMEKKLQSLGAKVIRAKDE